MNIDSVFIVHKKGKLLTIPCGSAPMGLLDWLRRFFRGSKVYPCPTCGYVMPKKEAVLSGWDSQQSLRHVHCPNCGKIIEL